MLFKRSLLLQWYLVLRCFYNGTSSCTASTTVPHLTPLLKRYPVLHCFYNGTLSCAASTTVRHIATLLKRYLVLLLQRGWVGTTWLWHRRGPRSRAWRVVVMYWQGVGFTFCTVHSCPSKFFFSIDKFQTLYIFRYTVNKV